MRLDIPFHRAPQPPQARHDVPNHEVLLCPVLGAVQKILRQLRGFHGVGPDPHAARDSGRLCHAVGQRRDCLRSRADDGFSRFGLEEEDIAAVVLLPQRDHEIGRFQGLHRRDFEYPRQHDLLRVAGPDLAQRLPDHASPCRAIRAEDAGRGSGRCRSAKAGNRVPTRG